MINYNEIINNINTKNCISLINQNILHLVTHISNCDYGVYVLGSCACISAWICKIPGIQFGRPQIGIYENMDKLLCENNPKIIYFNDPDKISYDSNKNFNITGETIFNSLPEFTTINK